MANAIVPRRNGDIFQARLFWMKALCLLDQKSPVIKVGFEIGPKAFDDIWVEYDQKHAPLDQNGNSLLREHIQCKWHVSQGHYSYSDLINPDFINASSRSLLQRAREAQKKYAPDCTGIRFKLVTNWLLDPKDPLKKMIHQRDGTIRLDRLFRTKTDNSAAGKIRKEWRDHLSIDNTELIHFARTLAFSPATDLLDDLRDILDVRLAHVGLRRIPLNESTFHYDDLTFQWLGQGRLEFDSQTFREVCKSEGLFDEERSERIIFGVKSFEHAFDRLEDRCEKTLNLIQYFNERSIRQQDDWTNVLYLQLKDFLLEAAKSHDYLRLIVDAHITLAFAAGTILNIKSGREIELEQRTISRSIWHPNDSEEDTNWPIWDFDTRSLDSDSNEMAVAVGLTHDIQLAVLNYIEEKLPGVSRLLVATPTSGVGVKSVVNGKHAFQLAEKLSHHINDKKIGGVLHLFISGPNAFSFFLGQRQPSLGKVILYEYDFENQNGSSYTPSLSLPV